MRKVISAANIHQSSQPQYSSEDGPGPGHAQSPSTFSACGSTTSAPRRWYWLLGLIAAGFFLLRLYGDNSEASSEEFWRISRIRRPPSVISSNSSSQSAVGQTGAIEAIPPPPMPASTWAPLIVHQTWKSKSLPPHQTLRWRSGCQVTPSVLPSLYRFIDRSDSRSAAAAM